MTALLLAAGAARAEYPVGVSLGMVKVPEPEKLAQIKAAGIDHVEVVFNYFWRNAPENECYTRAYRVKAMLDEAGLEVWSCHLPFSRTLDISVLDPQRREENVLLMERMIRLAEIFHPQRLVLHPSSEPISDGERETRLQNSANSIGRLALAAKGIGAVLCIENLPRTCLGRDSGEIMRLIGDFPEVMVCFDSNHLLQEEHARFFEPWAAVSVQSTLRTTTVGTNVTGCRARASSTGPTFSAACGRRATKGSSCTRSAPERMPRPQTS